MNIPKEDIEKWKLQLNLNTPSKVLRDISNTYGISKSTLGFILTDLYEEVSTPEVQAVWKWDIKSEGKGLSDKEIDSILSKLTRK